VSASPRPTPRPARVPSRRILLLAGAALAVVLAGCGTDPEGTPEPAAGTDLEALVDDLDAKPDPAAILVDDRGSPPAELVVEDVVAGDGATAEAGDLVRVHYVGVDWESGEQFDASWDRGTPLEFPLGQGFVIPGWDQGVEGMQVGGRRVLTIPPDLAYGEQGAGGVIGPNATLVFVVDLVEVEASEG
jgi:peptidylprolyl isomerase